MSAKRSSIKMLEINAGMPLFYVIKKLNVPCKTMKVSGYHLYLYDGCFENITELYLKNSHFPKEAILKTIMQQIKTCEILGLECCQFGFKHFTFVALEIGLGRCTKLNVHLSENIYQSNNFMVSVRSMTYFYIPKLIFWLTGQRSGDDLECRRRTQVFRTAHGSPENHLLFPSTFNIFRLRLQSQIFKML